MTKPKTTEIKVRIIHWTIKKFIWAVKKYYKFYNWCENNI